jgi:hypothetical protein
MAVRPHRALDLVLADRARLVRTLARGEHLPWVVGILLGVSVLSALPYGAVLGPERAWRVAALTVGSVAVCFPSLHVVGGYLGSRSSVGQDFGRALVVSAVAGVLTLGFAPIVAFVRWTTPAGSDVAELVAAALLAVSVLAGVARLGGPGGEGGRAARFVTVAWAGLFLFVVHRMGVFLGLG